MPLHLLLTAHPVCPPSLLPAAPYAGGATAGSLQDVLNLHNTLRARHGAPALAWDASIAASAQAWADRCVFGHGASGENLAQNFPTPTAAVQVRARAWGHGWLPMLPLRTGLAACTRAHTRSSSPITPPSAAQRNMLTRASSPCLPTTHPPGQAWYDEIRLYNYVSGGYSQVMGAAGVPGHARSPCPAANPPTPASSGKAAAACMAPLRGSPALRWQAPLPAPAFRPCPSRRPGT